MLKLLCQLRFQRPEGGFCFQKKLIPISQHTPAKCFKVIMGKDHSQSNKRPIWKHIVLFTGLLYSFYEQIFLLPVYWNNVTQKLYFLHSSTAPFCQTKCPNFNQKGQGPVMETELNVSVLWMVLSQQGLSLTWTPAQILQL